MPLILAGWAYSNDVEKIRRWEETVAWAGSNSCSEIVELPDEDFYYVDEPSSYIVGPLGGPMYRPWDFDKKDRLPSNQVAEHLETLKSRWQDIAGPELARVTRPLAFTGDKARRLLVQAMIPLGPRGVAGRISLRSSPSAEHSPVSGHQSTEPSLHTRSITSTSQPKDTPNKALQGTRRKRHAPEHRLWAN